MYLICNRIFLEKLNSYNLYLCQFKSVRIFFGFNSHVFSKVGIHGTKYIAFQSSQSLTRLSGVNTSGQSPDLFTDSFKVNKRPRVESCIIDPPDKWRAFCRQSRRHGGIAATSKPNGH